MGQETFNQRKNRLRSKYVQLQNEWRNQGEQGEKCANLVPDLMHGFNAATNSDEMIEVEKEFERQTR